MKEPGTMNCPHCRSDHVVKAGVRRLKTGPARQLYRCNDCCRRFSTLQRHGKRTPGGAILRALVLVCRGCSYDEASLAIGREFGVRPSKASISRWVTERTLPYLEIREKMAVADGPLVRSYLFTHNGLNYRFLNGDRNTIATEIPVYFRHSEYGLTAGHIDLLQVSGGEVQILDYKPNAAREKPSKVVSQLSLYAEALSRRAKLPVEKIRCGYFDEQNAYFFRPVVGKKASKGKTSSIPNKGESQFSLYQSDRTSYHGKKRKSGHDL